MQGVDARDKRGHDERRFRAVILAVYTATLCKKVSTSARKSPAAAATASEAVSTVSADWRVSVAAPTTSASTEAICLVPRVALATFWEMSPVAALCSCTD